ncbi:MAG: hypothetical protein DRI80_11165 [Chloroflexota bacterium]|nr:MAG: hypothetical protein DRI80_11165 [Chloroflexota bacterium]
MKIHGLSLVLGAKGGWRPGFSRASPDKSGPPSRFAPKMSLIILVIIATLMPLSVGAQSPNTYTSIIVTDVLSGAPVVGGTFITDLQVSITNSASPQVGVMSVEIWLPFDSSVVTVSDFDGNPANGTQVEIKNGFFDGDLTIEANEVIIGAMPSSAPPECTTAGACVHVAVGHTGGSGPVTNRTETVATITWAGLATGSPAIGIAVVPPGVPPGSVLSDPAGEPIPINSTSVPTIIVTDTGAIEGVVQRQGTQTGHTGTDITTTAAGDRVVATATTTADGGFSLVVPMGNTYTINASYPGYLQSQKDSVHIVGTTVDIGPTTLVGGDVNADNCINILDVVSIIGKFGRTGLPASTPEDINDDGMINILDLTIAAGNFTRCGPTPWVLQ